MSPHCHDLGHAEWRARGEVPRVEARGPDPTGIRATPGGALPHDLPGAPPPEVPATRDQHAVTIGEHVAFAGPRERCPGGTAVRVAAPLDRIPLFPRGGARSPVRGAADAEAEAAL